MGYAGYVPAKMATALTDTQKALRKIKPDEALETVSKVVRNVAQAPKEPKYRKIRLTNEKIKVLIVDSGAVEAMELMGWTKDPADADFLVLPEGVHHTMAQVRDVDGARDALKEEVRLEARKRAAAKKPLDPERERLKQQMMADRAERASRGPVTQGSSAQALPNNGGVHQGKYDEGCC
mmetsp:Transcript_18159/g.58715  ORF Transcript_18159/g.58715 Transcript_18159/m.58715 type:complete len:179 (-) Transcript_18159:140-676(-)